MIPARWMVQVATALLFLGLSPLQAEPDPNMKAASLFQVRWWAVNYDKQVRVVNGQDSTIRRLAWESVRLDWDVQMRDPNLVLGICREGILTQLKDSQGRDVNLPLPSSRPPPPQYTRLYWREVQLPPPRVPRWRALVQSAFRLKPSPSPPPQTVRQVAPVTVFADVGMGLLRKGDKEIGSVKGYFHALVAEAIEYVQVPFEPNDRWVSLPHSQIRVKKASCDETSFGYEIESRFETSPKLDGLQVVGPLLPSRVVISKQFLAADGKPVPSPSGNLYWNPSGAGGSGSGNLTKGPIKAIRFVIAVNATHRQIPFELQHIPLPDPQQPVNYYPGSR